MNDEYYYNFCYGNLTIENLSAAETDRYEVYRCNKSFWIEFTNGTF